MMKSKTFFALILFIAATMALPLAAIAAQTAAEAEAQNAAGQGAAVGNPNSTASGQPSAGGACVDRKKFADELNSNSDTMNELCQLILAETGAYNECAVMFVESVMNRAYARGKTVRDLIMDCAYWGGGCGQRKKNGYPAKAAKQLSACQATVSKVTSGSNTCNYCTDNASNPGSGKHAWFANDIIDGKRPLGIEPPSKLFAPVWCPPERARKTGAEMFMTKQMYEKKMKELEKNAPPGCESRPVTSGTGSGSGSGTGGSGGPQPTTPGQFHFNMMAESLKQIWVAAFQLMTSQLSTTMMMQVNAIGTFFDAKHQLETQRLMQEKAAQAHKDYQPSVQMCEIGTFARNLADSEKRSELTKTAISRAILDRELAAGDVKTMNPASDEDTKLKRFIDKFCSADDNARQNKELCGNAVPPEQKNADINYTQTIDAPLTLDVNFLDTTTEKQEETLFAFIDYIFMQDRFPWMPKSKTVLNSFIQPYQDMRSLIAMRSVARNSFAHIIAEKTRGPEDPETTVAPFIKALMRELGMEDKDIEERIGKYPSYYAQMEVLTKMIYQDPEFIANLYDKPANVKRIRAALTAIKVMQDRDIHEALKRREMLMSMLLELKLRKKQADLTNREIRDVLADPPGPPRGDSTATPTGTPAGKTF